MYMANTITMPKLGLTMTHGILSKWCVAEGDKVKKGEIIAEIETDKISSEYESPFEGTVLEILVEEGEEVKVTAPICVVGKTDGNVDANKRILITPAARKLAAEYNIDYTNIKGSKENGRISVQDIEKAHKSIQHTDDTEKQPDSSIEDSTVEKIPLTGIRRIISRRMTESKKNIPHVYFSAQVDMNDKRAFKENMHEIFLKRHNVNLSYTHIILRAVACSLEEYPDVNVSAGKNEILRLKSINIGLAVDGDEGLVVPVIKKANSLEFVQLCKYVNDAVSRAKSGNLTPDDLEGGTFTLTNLGMYGVDSFNAVINPPQAAILAVGAVRDMPAVVGGKLAVRPLMNMSLSTDHRVIDGVLAAKFLACIKKHLETPYAIMV